MTQDAVQNLETARRYLAAIERGDEPHCVGQFLHPQIVAEELPNRISPHGARRERAAMLEGVERGRELLRSQSYEITSEIAAGNRVVLEVVWRGMLARSLGDQLAAGTTLRARLAIFLEFRDGQIVAQRNYDCYDPC
ncbi:MAG: nuclear transport factor 2 family protein [Pirellulales bacterium]